MPGIGQRGFWDEQQRAVKLKNKMPEFSPTFRIDSLGIILPTTRQGLCAEAQNQCWSAKNLSADSLQNVGAPIAFQLERRHSLPLAVDETEFQVNDRHSFEEFVGLGVMNHIPDATTLAFLRERLRKAGVIEELFKMFESYLRDQSPHARGG